MFRSKTKLRQKNKNVLCAACGATASREFANYCLVCGKALAEDYQPLDALRSAHHLQGKAFLVENAPSEPITDLFEINRNSVSETAWASCVYSMVPFVGVIFIPFTVVASVWGTAIAFRYPNAGGLKMSLASLSGSAVVLVIQVLLWWLLYIVPELGRSI